MNLVSFFYLKPAGGARRARPAGGARRAGPAGGARRARPAGGARRVKVIFRTSRPEGAELAGGGPAWGAGAGAPVAGAPGAGGGAAAPHGDWAVVGQGGSRARLAVQQAGVVGLCLICVLRCVYRCLKDVDIKGTKNAVVSWTDLLKNDLATIKTNHGLLKRSF